MIGSKRIRIFQSQQSSLDEPTSATFNTNTIHESEKIVALRHEFMQLPTPDAKVSWWYRIPFVLPPFMFRRRVIQQVLYGGTELKSGMLEEYSLHVLVETLFITVSCQPLFDQVFAFQQFDLVHTIFISYFFFTVSVQVCSLSTNILWICAIVQLQESICQEWMAERLDILHLSGILHATSFYLFVYAILLWPLAIFPFPQSIFICAPAALMLMTFIWRQGPLLGVISKMTSPLLMLDMDPSDEKLRDLAILELQALTSSYTKVNTVKSNDSSIRAPSDLLDLSNRDWVGNINAQVGACDLDFSNLEKHLELEGMSRFAPTLRQQGVTLDVLPELTTEDFANMKINVGDKARILKGLKNKDHH